jgi:NAD(P)-dependent dehydrogenase (short-subunit alcohol dehydrogenase family)
MTHRTVLVTGGNRGIGLATARAFTGLGHSVAVTRHRSPAPADLFSVRCDVTDPDDWSSALAAVERQHGAVEVLVYSAGITDDAILLEMSLERFDRVVTTNLTGAYLAVRHAVRGMIRARWGRVILMSSVSGLWGVAGQANYTASKAGLIGFTKSVSKELASRNVLVNAVAPGFIETELTRNLTPDRRAALLEAIPLARWGQAAEVASAVLFLASDFASYITGQVLVVDGGMVL